MTDKGRDKELLIVIGFFSLYAIASFILIYFFSK